MVKNQRTGGKENWQKMKASRQRKMSKNQRSAFSEQWKKIEGPWSKKTGKTSTVSGQ